MVGAVIGSLGAVVVVWYALGHQAEIKTWVQNLGKGLSPTPSAAAGGGGTTPAAGGGGGLTCKGKSCTDFHCLDPDFMNCAVDCKWTSQEMAAMVANCKKLGQVPSTATSPTSTTGPQFPAGHGTLYEKPTPASWFPKATPTTSPTTTPGIHPVSPHSHPMIPAHTTHPAIHHPELYNPEVNPYAAQPQHHTPIPISHPTPPSPASKKAPKLPRNNNTCGNTRMCGKTSCCHITCTDIDKCRKSCGWSDTDYGTYLTSCIHAVNAAK
jgi:hypothetical protein